jgi:hypothetical protein
MNPVPPYAGQNQQQVINIPATIRYQMVWEEGPWVLPPYSSIYPPDSQAQGTAFVPPPIQKTDLWSAMQTWPM